MKKSQSIVTITVCILIHIKEVQDSSKEIAGFQALELPAPVPMILYQCKGDIVVPVCGGRGAIVATAEDCRERLEE